ncbi:MULTISPECIES: hypothetical protein [unclassified Mycolicibacterium]|uniref:hypothetical protein n=1 Tax=unclassified Mycolicibacterium TaxID=2636767 RepID=UPI002ED860B8
MHPKDGFRQPGGRRGMPLRSITPGSFGKDRKPMKLRDLSLHHRFEQARLRYIGWMRGPGPRIDMWRPGRYRIRFGLASL